jgi:hypothetical protein
LRRLIAIILLLFHLFSTGGYVVLHQYFTYKSDKFFNEQTSKNKYNINDLTEVRIPVSMPNITEWNCYENVTGHIQFENTSYNYVKMKITRNAIYLMCIPNYETTQLFDENVITAKYIKDIPVPKKEHVPYGKTNILEKFQFSFIQIAFNTTIKSIKIYTIQPVEQLSTSCLDIPEQPPRFFC